MSQPYYSGYSQPQYSTSDSYDSANTMHPPIQHTQSHASAYGYQNEYYDYGDTSSAYPVNNSSTLAQTYSYSDSNYIADATANAYSTYDSVPNHTITHHPDSGVPQYGDAAPGQAWTGPAQYTEATTDQPTDVYDQRRGSCTSMSANSDWYSHDNTNGEHYNYTQLAVVEQSHNAEYYHQQPDSQEPANFGMYSPTQHSRVQELARSASYDTQWMPVAPVSQGNFEAPYGTLPIHEPNTRYERRSSDAYQGYDNGPVGHPHPTQTSPLIQTHSPSVETHQRPVPPPANSPETRPKDLFIQQRQAASYQHGLQAQQELKYQLSGQLEQFEATRRRPDSFTVNQNYSYTLAHDTPHHQSHPAHHQRQGSSSSGHRLLSAPIVPSQARERVVPCSHSSPEVEEKKDTPPKKPALACLFCRKRKIACGPPPPDSLDRTCNQCLRRKQQCEYPTESRRGIRKTQKPEPVVPEEPTVHQFVHGEQHEFTGPIRNRGGRRKRD